MEIVSTWPWAFSTSTLRVSGACAWVRTGRDMAPRLPQTTKASARPAFGCVAQAQGLVVACFDFSVVAPAGAICADSGRTLGGAAALPAGECAPEVSSGVCGAGL